METRVFVVATCKSDELLIGGRFFGNPGIQASHLSVREKVQGDAQAYPVCISSRGDHPVRLYFN